MQKHYGLLDIFETGFNEKANINIFVISRNLHSNIRK